MELDGISSTRGDSESASVGGPLDRLLVCQRNRSRISSHNWPPFNHTLETGYASYTMAPTEKKKRRVGRGAGARCSASAPGNLNGITRGMREGSFLEDDSVEVDSAYKAFKVSQCDRHFWVCTKTA